MSTPPTHEELKKALKAFKQRLLLDQAASQRAGEGHFRAPKVS